MYWQITPYHTNDADYCLMRAETEADNQMALGYAQARLEAAWDQLQPGMLASVTIELCKGDMPDVDGSKLRAACWLRNRAQLAHGLVVG